MFKKSKGDRRDMKCALLEKINGIKTISDGKHIFVGLKTGLVCPKIFMQHFWFTFNKNTFTYGKTAINLLK